MIVLSKSDKEISGDVLNTAKLTILFPKCQPIVSNK
nr:MAG TPA: hypothetical protein [Caudoviricetes sp.]